MDTNGILDFNIMENGQLIIWAFGILGSVIALLLGGVLYFVKRSFNQAEKQMQETKKQDKVNAKEHLAIFERLTKGMGWFDALGKDVKRNGDNIEKLENKVGMHHDDIIKIKDKLDYKIVK